MVSIKTQKVLSYIPLLNATVLFVWLYNYHRVAATPKIFAKSLVVLFTTTIPLALFQVFLLKTKIKRDKNIR